MITYKSHMRKISLREEKSEYKKVKIQGSKDAYEILKPFFEHDMTLYESFFMLFLNQAGNTTGFVKISQGGIAGTVADVRVIAKYAIETLSPAVIIAHNHPTVKHHAKQAKRNNTNVRVVISKNKKTYPEFDWQKVKSFEI